MPKQTPAHGKGYQNSSSRNRLLVVGSDRYVFNWPCIPPGSESRGRRAPHVSRKETDPASTSDLLLSPDDDDKPVLSNEEKNAMHIQDYTCISP